jgi:hypothetical protein
MPRTPSQKEEAARRRRQRKAEQVVGNFLLHCNTFENRLNKAVQRLCRLDTISGAIVCANLNFQSKMGIIISLIEVYTGNEAKDLRDSHKKIYDRIFTLNSEWRNVVAHNMFSSNDEGAIEFTRIQAKRGLKIPDYVKSKTEFEDTCDELILLSTKLDRAVKLAVANRADHEAKSLKPKLDISQLGGLFGLPPPQGGLLAGLTSNPGTTPQTPSMGLLAGLSTYFPKAPEK